MTSKKPNYLTISKDIYLNLLNGEEPVENPIRHRAMEMANSCMQMIRGTSRL